MSSPSAAASRRRATGPLPDAARVVAEEGSGSVAGALAVAVLFAAVWSLGLWLIVLVLLSAAVVLARQRVLARQGLSARLVAWAEHAPCGPATPVALEHAVSVDLAAVSGGDLDALERAQARLGTMVDDPWRWALGEERLRSAYRLVADEALVGIRRRDAAPVARVRRAGAAAALIVFVALGTFSQSTWWLVPTAVAHVLVALDVVAFYERRWARPELLASRSLQEPVAGLFVMPEEAVVRSLVTLANHDRVVIQRARCLLKADGLHTRARRRLDEAERLLGDGKENAPGSSLGAWLLALAAPVLANAPPWGSP